jgi:diaminohydroxyphosphoribosylaminopyrimidine deaminase/5-amino-6-(5-phosphoribosylamino)uracil reductase
MAKECARLNEAFNRWIVRRTPLVTVKAGMTLDGKIATASGESRWITGEEARAYGMNLRQGADAILVGITTILADDPSLTVRRQKAKVIRTQPAVWGRRLRRIVLDAKGRTPLGAKVVCDEHRALTTVVVNRSAPKQRVAGLAKRVRVLVAPGSGAEIDLRWLLKRLGSQNVTSLLVEGGGEVNASFLLQGLAQRVAFFYAPKVLGGDGSRRAVAGEGARTLAESLDLTGLEWRRLGEDWLLSARIEPR